eukprot:758936-Hanusia_phi.AAC.6
MARKASRPLRIASRWCSCRSQANVTKGGAGAASAGELRLDRMRRVGGVWTESDLRTILGRGIVCIKRSGSDPERLIQENDLLYQVAPPFCRLPFPSDSLTVPQHDPPGALALSLPPLSLTPCSFSRLT